MTSEDDFARFGILPNTRMSGSFEMQLRCWVRVFRLLHSELRTRTGLPLAKRFRAWRSGFRARSWLLYRLDENDPRDYVSDLRMASHYYKVNGFSNLAMNNKLLLSRLLKAHGLPHPAVVSTIIDGRLIEEDGLADSEPGRALMRTLERYPRQVFRPTWSGAGQGVFFLKREADGLFLNDQAVSLEQASALLSRLDRYLATEWLEQAAYARKIYAHTTNTLRLLTVWDIESGESLVPAVVHRFGASHSGRLDNWHQGRGGVCAAVQAETGVLGKALRRSAEQRLIWESAHPETGAAIEGVTVPGFRSCLEGVKRTASCFPYCPCIGWDVVITEAGWRVLEANPIPGLPIVQAHFPLLADPRVRRVFERWGLAA